MQVVIDLLDPTKTGLSREEATTYNILSTFT